MTGVSKVHAIFGGTHLGFPGVPIKKVPQTINALKKIDPAVISPTHCTGFKAMSMIATQLPEKFFVSSVGTRNNI